MIEVQAWLFWGLFLLATISFGLWIYFYTERNRDPDGFLCITETNDKIKANFIFCIPVNEILKKKHLKIETRKMEDFDDDFGGAEG